MRMRSLFDPNFRSHCDEFVHHDYPYYLCVQSVDRSDDHRFPDDEASILSDVLEHEIQYHVPRGYLAGPISLRVGGAETVELSRLQSPFRIPTWVEADVVHFEGVTGIGILLIESWKLFHQLFRLRAWRSLNMVLASGNGVPRAGMRRLIHRLSTELNLPVYVVADCDTWGYYLYALHKRGILHPREELPPLAVDDLRFIGIRASDAMTRGIRADAIRPWKAHWGLRMRHIKQYRCFSGVSWKRELREFMNQKRAVDSNEFARSIGYAKFLKNYIVPRVKDQEWLT
jgi:DNA topoisomerase-6 subunit A